MCNWGTDVELNVPIPAGLSHTGEPRWALKKVDACIAPIIAALNDAGIYTASSCCGHGKGNGEILLHDGRRLVVVWEGGQMGNSPKLMICNDCGYEFDEFQDGDIRPLRNCPRCGSENWDFDDDIKRDNNE